MESRVNMLGLLCCLVFSCIGFMDAAVRNSRDARSYLEEIGNMGPGMTQRDSVKMFKRFAGLPTTVATVPYMSNAAVQCGGSIWPETESNNLALRKPASQSSTYSLQLVPAGLAVDGIEDGDWYHGSCASTSHENKPWWKVDLQEIYPIGSVKLSNRKCGVNNCGGAPSDIVEDRLSNFKIEVSKNNHNWELCVFYRDSLERCKDGCQKFYCPSGLQGRYVRVQLQDTNFLTLCEVAVFRPSKIIHLALGKVAVQSSNYPWPGTTAAAAVDGNIDGDFAHFSCSCTNDGDTNPWWKVDLGSVKNIGSVVLFNRQCRGSNNCGSDLAGVEDRLKSFKIEVSKDGSNWDLCVYYPGSLASCGKDWEIFNCPSGMSGRYVKVQKPGLYLTLCEVAVFGP